MKKVLLLTSLITLLSCTSNSSRKLETTIAEADKIDVPISVKIVSEKKSEQSELTFRCMEENDNIIIVEPTSPYYDRYISDSRMDIPMEAFVEGMPTEWNEYPQFEYYIVNNTQQTISINGLEIEVDNSQLDPFPYLRILTEEAYSNCLTLVNDSWTNWGNITLNYKILKRGETFDGVYEKKKNIPYFQELKRIDFISDLEEMGYDNQSVKQLWEEDYSEPDENHVLAYITDKDLDKCAEMFFPFEIGKKNNWSDYVGFARIYGELIFEDSEHKILFNGKLSLSTSGGFGAAMEEDDAFDVQLLENSQNYTKTFPYITSIESGGSERVGLTFMCPKSSNHTFRLKAINENGLIIQSKTIQLHLLNPKHSSKVLWQEQKKYY